MTKEIVAFRGYTNASEKKNISLNFVSEMRVAACVLDTGVLLSKSEKSKLFFESNNRPTRYTFTKRKYVYSLNIIAEDARGGRSM